MSEKVSKNSVEFYGYLARDPHIHEKTTFLTVAIPGDMDPQTQKEYGADFVDVSFFQDVAQKAKVFKKGDFVHVRGKLSTFQNKENHKEMRIVGFSIKEISLIKVRDKQQEKTQEKGEELTKDQVAEMDPF